VVEEGNALLFRCFRTELCCAPDTSPCDLCSDRRTMGVLRWSADCFRLMDHFRASPSAPLPFGFERVSVLSAVEKPSQPDVIHGRLSCDSVHVPLRECSLHERLQTVYSSEFMQFAAPQIHFLASALHEVHTTELRTEHHWMAMYAPYVRHLPWLAWVLPWIAGRFARGHHKLICQRLSALLERVLSMLFHRARPKLPIPTKLNQLLESKTLLARLDPRLWTVVMAFLGRLNSLNARNLLWHGYFTAFFPDHFASLLIALFFEISSRVNAAHIVGPEHTPSSSVSPAELSPSSSVRPAEHSPSASVRPDPSSSSTFLSAVEPSWSSSLRPEHLDDLPHPELATICALLQSDPDELTHLIEHSAFAVDCTKNEWKFAFELFSKDNDLVSCLCVLFPLLEHGLRCVYASENSIDNRFRIAESDSLFTSLDILLAPLLSPLCGAERRARGAARNRLLPLSGHRIVAALYTLFVWPRSVSSSSRLRDSIGHGLLARFREVSCPTSTAENYTEAHLLLCTTMCLLERFAGMELPRAPLLDHCHGAFSSASLNRTHPVYLCNLLLENAASSTRAFVCALCSAETAPSTLWISASLQTPRDLLLNACSLTEWDLNETEAHHPHRLLLPVSRYANTTVLRVDLSVTELNDVSVLHKAAESLQSGCAQLLQRTRMLSSKCEEHVAWARHREALALLRAHAGLLSSAFVALLRLCDTLLLDLLTQSGAGEWTPSSEQSLLPRADATRSPRSSAAAAGVPAPCVDRALVSSMWCADTPPHLEHGTEHSARLPLCERLTRFTLPPPQSVFVALYDVAQRIEALVSAGKDKQLLCLLQLLFLEEPLVQHRSSPLFSKKQRARIIHLRTCLLAWVEEL